ncbi:MAG: hypothetical protein IJQ12_01400 [Lachnospiraceae bacterium]|nr:hypothetical protein [Lachnospiraceae bacterium]
MSNAGNTAYLSNEGRYTVFRFGDEELRFIGPYSLERYDVVTEWDKGYIVVMTKYSHSEQLIEEYIDLIPVLRDLMMDAKTFLDPIGKVEVSYV